MSEKEVVEAAQELHDAIEANFARFYQRIAPKAQGSPKLKFDAEKMSWFSRIRDDGTKWQLANDRENGINPNYVELKKFLKEAGGNVQSEGKYYWLFTNGDAVGRQDSGTVKHRR